MYTYTKTKEEGIFIEFLANCNVYRQYMLNLAYTEKGKFSFFEFTYEIHHEYWINSAFDWAKSKEGFKFWEIINNKWMLIAEKMS